jgi:hypothetical protein
LDRILLAEALPLTMLYKLLRRELAMHIWNTLNNILEYILPCPWCKCTLKSAMKLSPAAGIRRVHAKLLTQFDATSDFLRVYTRSAEEELVSLVRLTRLAYEGCY